MNDYEFVKAFSKITIKKIAEKLKISRCNVASGRINAEKMHEVRRLIESEIAKLYIIKDD